MLFFCLKGTNRNTRRMCGIYSKLTIKTPERRETRQPGFFIINFERVNTKTVQMLGALVEQTILNKSSSLLAPEDYIVTFYTSSKILSVTQLVLTNFIITTSLQESQIIRQHILTGKKLLLLYLK